MIIFHSDLWAWNLFTCNDTPCGMCQLQKACFEHYRNYYACFSCFNRLLREWYTECVRKQVNNLNYEKDHDEYLRLFDSIKEFLRKNPELGLE